MRTPSGPLCELGVALAGLPNSRVPAPPMNANTTNKVRAMAVRVLCWDCSSTVLITFLFDSRPRGATEHSRCLPCHSHEITRSSQGSFGTKQRQSLGARDVRAGH